MKKIMLSIITLFAVCSVMAQIQDPVQWSYAAKKKANNVYEIVITGMLEQPWHIYSMSTPKGGPRPTKINFKKNPLLTLEGKLKENGKLKVEKDNVFGIDVKYYSDRIEFIQAVKLKGNIKTNIGGTVEYMVCDDSQCLPPTTKTFDIKLQ
ncbi:MAG: cytochrome c-type biosis protein DsbD, protein-disulfide reductase [Chitinophagaceae bacterium]|nr:cytochrome c-type biosis protein DsbD, protein-disulfide reductase [Chitinophagaceae bacterium]